MPPSDFAALMTRDLLLPDSIAPAIAAQIEKQAETARSVALPTPSQFDVDNVRGPVVLTVRVLMIHSTVTLMIETTLK